MLAVQLVHIYWEKDSRSPRGAVLRREHLHPYRIPDDAVLSGTGELFFQKCSFYQRDGNKMLTEKEFLTEFAENCTPWNQTQQGKQKAWQRVAEADRQAKGIFIENAADCGIKGLDMILHGDEFEIQFYSLGEEGLYVPPRYGKNILHPSGQEYGRTLKRETAFILAPAESGVVRYNYRMHHSVTGYEGTHYEFFDIYLVNTDKLNPNSFTKAQYGKTYEDVVQLF